MGAGNIYRHNDDKVAEQMIWSAIENDLPPLLEIGVAELDAFDKA